MTQLITRAQVVNTTATGTEFDEAEYVRQTQRQRDWVQELDHDDDGTRDTPAEREAWEEVATLAWLDQTDAEREALEWYEMGMAWF